MKGFDELLEVLDAGKTLRGVRYLVDPELDAPTSVRLVFDGTAVTVRIDPDSDTLFVEPDRPHTADSTDLKLIDASKRSVWKAANGASLRWLWYLTNHQGYADGVQLEFVNEETDRRSCVQLLAIGSQITVQRVVR